MRDVLNHVFSFSPGVNKTVLKTMSVMDLDKVNLELIEALLEWIVAGKHSYPPGNFTVLEGETKVDLWRLCACIQPQASVLHAKFLYSLITCREKKKNLPENKAPTMHRMGKMRELSTLESL